MAIYNYARLNGRVGVFQRINSVNRRWFDPATIDFVKMPEDGVMIVQTKDGTYSATINPATDTVVLDGTTIAAGGTLNALETAIVGSPVFLKPSSGGGGGSIPTGTDKQVVGYDASGNPVAVSLGVEQLSDINGYPPFANGLLALTAMNPETKTALKVILELALGTPKNGAIPSYGEGGVLKVSNGVAPGDAINKAQFDAKIGVTQEMYDFVLSLMNSGN